VYGCKLYIVKGKAEHIVRPKEQSTSRDYGVLGAEIRLYRKCTSAIMDVPARANLLTLR